MRKLEILMHKLKLNFNFTLPDYNFNLNNERRIKCKNSLYFTGLLFFLIFQECWNIWINILRFYRAYLFLITYLNMTFKNAVYVHTIVDVKFVSNEMTLDVNIWIKDCFILHVLTPKNRKLKSVVFRLKYIEVP